MSTQLLNTSRDGDSTTALDNPFHCLITRSVKKYFLTSSLNLPWHNLRPSLLSVACCLVKEAHPQLSATSFQTAVEGNEVSPQPPLLQTKHPPSSLSRFSFFLVFEILNNFKSPRRYPQSIQLKTFTPTEKPHKYH